MARVALPLKARIVGWGNLGAGMATPLRLIFHIAAGLRVFSYSWCADSIFVLLIIGSTLGVLTGASGWGLLRQQPWARRISCMAGGATVGYSVIGIFIMLFFGIGRELQILIRHGSTDWWEWSISHFQSPVFIELPIAIWWIFALTVVLRLPQPRGPNGLLTKNLPGLGLVFVSTIVGGLSRLWQMWTDVSHYSQR